MLARERAMISTLKIARRGVLGALCIALASSALSVPSFAQEVTIPIIVKDTTSFYWQIVLAGARAAGEELGVNVPELGAQAETDINGQISILENAVAGNPAAIVIAPRARFDRCRSGALILNGETLRKTGAIEIAFPVTKAVATGAASRLRTA